MTWYMRQGSELFPRKRSEKRQNGCLRRLQIAVKKREVKSKGEKERYPFECRVPQNSKETRKLSLEINTKK